MLDNDLLSAFTEEVKQLCTDLPLSSIDFHIALSGGMDSVVLLHLFSRLRAQQPNLKISAHHVNHGISTNAASWAAFCEQLCASLCVDFMTTAVDLQKKSRTSLEALARDKRYHALIKHLSENSYLVSAHHQDDQLETVLLALKRGSGNTGLQGVRRLQALATGHLIRPLLNFSRQQLEAYAQFFNLTWIEDESNTDQTYDRNFIRHTISPLLKSRWPAIAKTVSRSAAICQEQQQLLDEVAALDFSQCADALLNENVVDINALKKLSQARRHNVLRYWFKVNQLSYPSAKQLVAIWQNIVLAGKEALPSMAFNERTLRRYREHLYLVKTQQNAACNTIFTWSGESQVSLLDGKLTLKFTSCLEAENGLTVLPGSVVTVCFRCQLPAKVSCRPEGRNGSRSVKKLLHEYHVPPWLRDVVPFVLIDGVLQQAVGLWRCHQPLSPQPSCYLSVSFA